jgi:hypothetical protein
MMREILPVTPGEVEYAREYKAAIDRLNNATDREIDEAMANIHRQQRQRNGLRPARALRYAFEGRRS